MDRVAADKAGEPDSSVPPPPGWYPEGGFVVRWWDGSQWTDRRAIPDASPIDRRKRTVLAIVAGGLGVLLLVGSFVAYAYFSGEAHDARSLDDEVIRATAAKACTAVTQQIEAATGSRAQRIEIGNDAIAQLVDDMDAIGTDRLKDDKPALDWITDWRMLSGARSAFGELTITTLGAEARFIVPTSDGYPITERMIDVSPQQCARAVDLAADP